MQVPFEVIDGRIYVEGEVNGRGPFRFAVDTGASGLGRADARLVTALDLEAGRQASNSDGVGTAQAGTVRLDSIGIGRLMREDLEVITRDYNASMAPEAAIDGIIAREFFVDGLLIIDYPRRVLSFSRTLALSSGHADLLTYQRPFRIPVTLGDMQVEGNLDTGANVTFVLPRAAFDQLDASPPQQAGSGQLANTRIETARATVHGPVRIGALRYSDIEVRVSSDYPEVLIGAHALRDVVVLIDQRSNSLALCR